MLEPGSLTSSTWVSCSTIKLLQFHLKGLRPEPVKKYETSEITQLPFSPLSSEELAFPAWLCGEGKSFYYKNFIFIIIFFFQEVTFTQESFKPQSPSHRLSCLKNHIISPKINLLQVLFSHWRGCLKEHFNLQDNLHLQQQSQLPPSVHQDMGKQNWPNSRFGNQKDRTFIIANAGIQSDALLLN